VVAATLTVPKRVLEICEGWLGQHLAVKAMELRAANKEEFDCPQGGCGQLRTGVWENPKEDGVLHEARWNLN